MLHTHSVTSFGQGTNDHCVQLLLGRRAFRKVGTYVFETYRAAFSLICTPPQNPRPVTNLHSVVQTVGQVKCITCCESDRLTVDSITC